MVIWQQAMPIRNDPQALLFFNEAFLAKKQKQQKNKLLPLVSAWNDVVLITNVDGADYFLGPLFIPVDGG